MENMTHELNNNTSETTGGRIVQVNLEEQMKAAEKLYNELCDAGVETLLDDRSERAGVKFKDADLIGIPVRVVVGKKLGEGIVEYKERKMENAVEIALTDAVSKVTEFVKANI